MFQPGLITPQELRVQTRLPVGRGFGTSYGGYRLSIVRRFCSLWNRTLR